MTLTLVHNNLFWASLMFAAAAGVIGIFTYWRRPGMTGTYWGVLATAVVLFAAQGLVGVLLFIDGLRPDRGIHWLYGVTMLLTIPGYYLTSNGRDDRRAVFIYTLICFFLAGVALRARGTG